MEVNFLYLLDVLVLELLISLSTVPYLSQFKIPLLQSFITKIWSIKLWLFVLIPIIISLHHYSLFVQYPNP
jgi:hypothetical protein